MRLILQALNLAIYALLLPLALYRLVRGAITIGDFLLISTLMIQLIRNVFDMANGLPETYDTIGSIRDSLAMLIVPRDIRDRPGATDMLVTRGEVAFDGIGFAYDHKKPIFDRLALTIPAGQRVGLIGHSGAGKTTLVTLLMRLYDVQQGAIRIDGQNIAEVTQASLRRSIGLIPQDVILFHRTLMENIRYGRPASHRRRGRGKAARAAYIHGDEIETLLPQGYETAIGMGAHKDLSGGQKQRLSIARALLKNAPILLLDEATSALNFGRRGPVQRAGWARRLMLGRDGFIALAHRLSTLPQRRPAAGAREGGGGRGRRPRRAARARRPLRGALEPAGRRFSGRGKGRLTPVNAIEPLVRAHTLKDVIDSSRVLGQLFVCAGIGKVRNVQQVAQICVQTVRTL